ncbi:MAG: hypothetical protein LBJ94_01740 [Puniceicoccales bacterium]|jgi:hypothetical protein|nr:hypothetical protein [Puniceicoccales bacterium]
MKSASASPSSNVGQVHIQHANSSPNISSHKLTPANNQRGLSASATQPPAQKKSLFRGAMACIKKTVASVVKSETFGKALNIISKVTCIGAATVSIVFPPAALVTGIIAASIALLGVLRDVAVTVKSNERLDPQDRVSLGSSLLSSAIGVVAACPIGNVLSIAGTVAGALIGGIGCILSASRERNKLKEGGLVVQGGAIFMEAMPQLLGSTRTAIALISAVVAGVGYFIELAGSRSPKKHSESAGIQNQTA